MATCKNLVQIKVDGMFINVPCNKCNFCLQNRRQDWSFRLYQEFRHAKTGHFINLTYDETHCPLKYDSEDLLYKALHREDLHAFHKLIKQAQTRVLKKLSHKQKWSKQRRLKEIQQWKIRYYSVGEYGSKTYRPHYHSIMINIHPETLTILHRVWGRGHVVIGTVTNASIAYVTKYAIDKEPENPYNKERPFATMSRNPGIGADYLKMMRIWHRQSDTQEDGTKNRRYYVMYQGHKQRIPRYYKDKLFSKFERMVEGIKQCKQSEERYLKEIIRLSEFHENPVLYYLEALEQKHERIRTKSLELNSL